MSGVHFQKCSNFSIIFHTKNRYKIFSPPRGGGGQAQGSPKYAYAQPSARGVVRNLFWEVQSFFFFFFLGGGGYKTVK